MSFRQTILFVAALTIAFALGRLSKFVSVLNAYANVVERTYEDTNNCIGMVPSDNDNATTTKRISPPQDQTQTEQTEKAQHVLQLQLQQLAPYELEEIKCQNQTDTADDAEETLPQCSTNLNMTGEWVYTPNRTFLNPVCCTGAPGAWQQENSDQCTTITKEELSYSYTGHANLYQHSGGSWEFSCDCKYFQDDYIWKSPELVDFNPQEFCRLLGSRTVLFTGDSTMQQTGTTMMNTLIPAGCQTQLTVALSDKLIAGVKDRGKPWKEQIETMKPDIAVLTAGAWLHTDSNYLTHMRGIVSDIAQVRQQFPNMHIVWKTQNPAGCTPDIRHPNDPVTAAHKQPFAKKSYQHAKFFNRDLYAMTQMQLLKVPILDMRMLYSRSDAHISSLPGQRNKTVDCMHFCLPGPLEVIAPLFQHLLATKLTDQSSLAAAASKGE